jgi:hypothetical protein
MDITIRKTPGLFIGRPGDSCPPSSFVHSMTVY